MPAYSNTFTVQISTQSAPSWVAGLPLNTWTALSNVNTLSSVAANVGPSTTEAVMTAWNGAALATNYGASGGLIHWGGGHADYYGNEVYAFNLATLTWARLSDPYSGSMFPPSPSNGLWSNSTPAVPHTYYYVGYRPVSNEFFTAIRSTTNQGGGSQPRVSRFNLNTNTWANSSQEAPQYPYDDEGCVYDSSRDSFWTVNAVTAFLVARYSFASDSYVQYSLSPVLNGGPLVYIPTKDCLVRFHVTGGNGARGVDCTNPAEGTVSISFTGSGPSSYSYGNMPQWSSNLGKMVWYPSRSNQLFTLTPPTGDWKTQAWTWAPISMSGSTGTHSGSTGTYGKFQIAQWGSSTVALVNSNYTGACVAARLS